MKAASDRPEKDEPGGSGWRSVVRVIEQQAKVKQIGAPATKNEKWKRGKLH